MHLGFLYIGGKVKKEIAFAQLIIGIFEPYYGVVKSYNIEAEAAADKRGVYEQRVLRQYQVVTDVAGIGVGFQVNV